MLNKKCMHICNSLKGSMLDMTCVPTAIAGVVPITCSVKFLSENPKSVASILSKWNSLAGYYLAGRFNLIASITDSKKL